MMKKWVLLIIAGLLVAACNEPDELEPEKMDEVPPTEWEVMEY